MLPFHSIRWNVFLSVAAVATLAVATAAYAPRVPGFSIATALVVGVGAYWVAWQVEEPLRALLKWANHPSDRAARVNSHDEWLTVADAMVALFVTNKARADDAEAEREHLRAVMDTMADGVLVADAASHIQLANRTAQTLFEGSGPIAVGRTIIECTMSVPLDTAVREAIATGATHFVDMGLVYPQTRQLRVVVSASGEGADRAAVAVLHDVTESVRVDRVRRDFVANVSHELRTPVSGIQTMAENLLGGALEDPTVARHFLDHILDSSRRLVAIVDDLLDLARAESDIPPPADAVAAAPIVREVIAELEHTGNARGLEIGMAVPESAIVLANADSVRQIITNLVENAMKYSPKGGAVDVTADDDGQFVTISVSDHGIGIAPEHHARIFERFYRVDRARSREVGGTGLGLSIVRHLAERLDGSVDVDSAPGRGSTFSVRLPRAPQ